MGENRGASQSFGKDFGLIHEVVVTGRKVGADEAFYASLAHDEGLFSQVVQFVKSGDKLEEVVARPTAPVKQTGLFDYIDSVQVGGTPHFAVGEKVKVGVMCGNRPIAYVNFGDAKSLASKVETNVPAATLRRQRLRKRSLDKPIMAELGDTTTLFFAQVWAAMELSIEGVSYVPDDSGQQWAVDRHLHDDGWGVYISSVADTAEWSRACKFVSR